MTDQLTPKPIPATSDDYDPAREEYDYFDCPCGTCGGHGTLTEWGPRKITCVPCNGTGREFWTVPRGSVDR